MRPVFREVQPWWMNRFLLAFLPLESLFLTAVLGAVAARAPWKDRWVLLGVWVLGAVVIPAAFLAWRLVITVTADTLRAGFVGVPGWRIPLSEVEDAEVIRVDAMRDFRGWGWRSSRTHGRVLNVWGDRAVRLTLRGGKVRTLGTQRPEELAEAVLTGAIAAGRGAGPVGAAYSGLGTSKA